MPAANDHLDAAVALSGWTGTYTMDFTGADYLEVGEEAWWGGPHKSLWYRWTAPATGYVQFYMASGGPGLWDIAAGPDAVDFASWTATWWAWNPDQLDGCVIPVNAGDVILLFVDDYSYETGSPPSTAVQLGWRHVSGPPPPPPPPVTFWNAAANSPEFQQYGFFAEVGGILYYGLPNGPFVWSYDPATNTWTDPAACSAYEPTFGPSQLAAADAQGTTDPSGDSIWILGNWRVGATLDRKMGLVRWYPATNTHDPFLYNTLGYDSTWGERLLTSAFDHTLVVTETHLYYFYPSIAGNIGFDQRWTHSVLMIYDRAADAWSASTPMPYSFVDGGSAVTDGEKIYLTGLIMDSTPDPRDGDLWIYDIATDSWLQGADAPIKTKHTDAVYVDGKIWVLGGSGASVGPWAWTSHAQIYDIATDSWSTVDDVLSGGGADDVLRTLVFDHKIWVTNLNATEGSTALYWHLLLKLMPPLSYSRLLTDSTQPTHSDIGFTRHLAMGGGDIGFSRSFAPNSPR